MTLTSTILDQERKREPRFGFLFVMLILALAVPSFLPRGTALHLSLQILITGILLVGLTSVSGSKRLLAIGIVVVIPAVVLSWLARIVDHKMIIASNILAIVFLLFLSILIIAYLLRAKRADSNTIYGAICVFMLLGFIWGLAFFVFEVIDPSALSSGTGLSYDDVGDLLEATSSAVYMSFVTLTSLGYGDITPTSHATRTLAVIEAVLGQLFLIVMISRFVGLNIAHSLSQSETKTARAAAEQAVETAAARETLTDTPDKEGRPSGRP